MKHKKILVLGNTGFVGKNLLPILSKNGFSNVIDINVSDKANLINQSDTNDLFENYHPEIIINLAGKVGGIAANLKDPYKFLYDNLMIQSNVINTAVKLKVEKVINMASSCMFPKDYPLQPLREEYLLKDDVEQTNAGYALAKIIGVKMAEFANKQFDTKFITLSPTNIYGPHDHFNLETSHALSALILKVYNAIQDKDDFIEVWGSGRAKREWGYVDDICDSIIWSIKNLDKTETFLNVGTGIDISMNDLALKIIELFRNHFEFGDIHITNDVSRPEGMLEKRLDVSKINNLGWKAKTNLDDGIKNTIDWFLKHGVKNGK